MNEHLVQVARRLLDGQLSADAREPVDGVLSVGFDIVGDHAAAVLLHVTDQRTTEHSLVMRREAASWRVLGGGSGWGGDGDGQNMAVPERVARWADRTTPTLGGAGAAGRGGLATDGGGSTLICPGFWPWSGRYLSHLTVVCGARITELRVRGAERAIPWHGRVVVAWEAGSSVTSVGRDGLSMGVGGRRPEIVAVDADGGRHPLPSEPRPRRRRARRAGPGPTPLRPE